MRRLTQEEFIARSIAKHGDKYDYSKVVYVKNSEKVCIICKECGQEFWQTPNQHMQGNGCPYCRGKHVWDKRGRITKEEFIRRAREIHGDKYGYDQVEYKNMKTKVKIYCKKCDNYFEQTPEHHLQGCTCPTCEMASRAGRPLPTRRVKVRGIGILDVNFSHSKDKETRHVYRVWMNILRRCYTTKRETKEKSYEDCYVCDEWKHFSNFLSWWKDNYVNGYAIDKDICHKGNRCYCPEYCVFVPSRINSLVIKRQNFRGDYPIGVSRSENGKFVAKVGELGRNVQVGTYDTPEDAFYAYKEEKERYIKEVANDYYAKGLITKRVYDALYRWTIEITD